MRIVSLNKELTKDRTQLAFNMDRSLLPGLDVTGIGWGQLKVSAEGDVLHVSMAKTLQLDAEGLRNIERRLNEAEVQFLEESNKATERRESMLKSLADSFGISIA